MMATEPEHVGREKLVHILSDNWNVPLLVTKITG